MKQLLVTLLLAAFTFSANAITPEEIFSQFQNKPNAEYTHIPKRLLNTGATFFNKEMGYDAKEVVSHVNSITVLDLGDCDRKVRADINKLVQLTAD